MLFERCVVAACACRILPSSRALPALPAAVPPGAGAPAVARGAPAPTCPFWRETPLLPSRMHADFLHTTHPTQAYLAYHPDLAQQGITTPEAAAAHYVSRGRAEGRPARRLRVLLRYTACAGLINQQYSHIAAFALAAALGAEVVLPPAVCRDSFAHYFRWVLGAGCWLLGADAIQGRQGGP